VSLWSFFWRGKGGEILMKAAGVPIEQIYHSLIVGRAHDQADMPGLTYPMADKLLSESFAPAARNSHNPALDDWQDSA